MSVKRIFVEKKAEHAVEAQGTLKNLKENLALDFLLKVRLVSRYDVEGISDDNFERAVKNVFSEPAVDEVYFEELDTTGAACVFGVEYLPGQYDQRADSAAQCTSLLTCEAAPAVKYAKIYVLYGKISDEDVERVKKYLINPVDSCEASLSKPESLKSVYDIPEKVALVHGFTEMTRAELDEYRADAGLAMSLDDLEFTQKYFLRDEHRDPTVTEIKVIDTYWSDHCRHTTFGTHLTDIYFEKGTLGSVAEKIFKEFKASQHFVYGEDRPTTLMQLGTIYAKEMRKRGQLTDMDVSEEINACSIKQTVKTDKGDRPYLIMFKNETHNHPTEIEPFGGAATCLGGAIRDPLSGRSYVYQAMRVTGCADPRGSADQALPGKIPQKKLTREAARGYSSYGNQIGLATGLVNEIYHEGYVAKRMEIGAVVGAAPVENVIRKRPEDGDIVILIGGRTGRDGIGGATGSSKAHDESSAEKCGAEVQKGNAPTERKLQRLFRNPEFTRLVKRCNDFGAGGVSVAIGELADALEINLDNVPKKYDGLDGTELAISESQERMAVVVAASSLRDVLRLAAEENLEATKVADVTATGRMRMHWNGSLIVDIKRSFLDTNGVSQSMNVFVADPKLKGLFPSAEKQTLAETAKSVLSDLNVCSQKGLIEMFDSSIGANTVLMPLGGATQLTPTQAMAAKVPVLGAESETATVMSYGFDPYVSEQSPLHGAVYSIVSSVAKLVAAGGDHRRAWLSLQEYFESLEKNPQKWGKPFAALLGAWYAQRELGIAAIGGKDSMSGTFKDYHVPPTLCSFAICTEDAKNIISPELKESGNKLYIVEPIYDEHKLPEFLDLKLKYDTITRLIHEGAIVSAYAVGHGGALAAAIKMAVGNKLGVKFESSETLRTLTRKRYGALVLESTEALPDGCGFKLIGTVTDLAEISLGKESVSIDNCIKWFTSPLESVFPTKVEQPSMPETTPYTKRIVTTSATKFARPRVLLPVFPGTNCEFDSARAFENAGAIATTRIIRNLTAHEIEESAVQLASDIKNSQIIMIPGGFSGGDEPDGSGKFIAALFRNPMVADAVHELLYKRDGLMIGICNGFQALIKLGLLPYGKICDMRPDSPTLSFNTIGRHASCIVNTRIASVASPWLTHVNPGEVHSIAVSHGEGRFTATEAEVRELFKNGQVFSQYCTPDGTPSMDIAHNPNGSLWAVEGLVSPDGRIIGKMGHTERYTENTMINIPGNKKQPLFRAGVEYFL